jgi:hypothetical protein
MEIRLRDNIYFYTYDGKISSKYVKISISYKILLLIKIL